MSRDEEDDKTIYRVVVNHEEQYSIWPADRENALGWNDVGKVGPKAECLEYIKEVWTDMRPLSLRIKMEELSKNPLAPPPPPDPNRPVEESLVDRLSEGDHQVKAGLGTDRSVELFKQTIDRDYVFIQFTQTRGGTGLGVRLDKDSCDFSDADFENGTGRAHLEGRLTLDYTPVRCIADIDLATLEGTGRLVKVEAAG